MNIFRKSLCFGCDISTKVANQAAMRRNSRSIAQIHKVQTRTGCPKAMPSGRSRVIAMTQGHKERNVIAPVVTVSISLPC